MTIRRRIRELLELGDYAARDLSQLLSVSEKDLYDHLAHVEKSAPGPKGIIARPAECLDCGFVFKDRRKLKPPSRCPKCRSEAVTMPVYGMRKR